MEPGQTRTQSATFHAFSDKGVHVRSNELRSYVTRQWSPDGRGADPNCHPRSCARDKAYGNQPN
jgi:hypothetical protein